MLNMDGVAIYGRCRLIFFYDLVTKPKWIGSYKIVFNKYEQN